MKISEDREEQLKGYGKLSEDEMKYYFDGKDDVDVKQPKLPPKPAKGELIVCQVCGHNLYPRMKRFLEDEKIPREHIMQENKIDAKREYTFHVHHLCREKMLNQADTQTPGLLSERKEINEMLNK